MDKPAPRKSSLTVWLANHPAAFTVIASVAAFGAYTCMYAFRKPFSAGVFKGMSVGGYDLKPLLVVAQMLGYAFSKLLGIKIVSEASAARRVAMIAAFIGTAGLALLVLPLVPPPVQLICLFVNGLPLGMVWGLVFSFLEGRRVTEFLGLGLSVSFIFASGWTKSVGAWLVHSANVPELWMPVTTGLLFVPLLALCLFFLSHLPAPDANDVKERTERKPMDGAARMAFIRSFGPVIGLLTICYLLLTVYRDLRDTYMADVLKELGYKGDSSVFARIETFAGLGVLAALAGLWYIKDHWKAILVYHWVIAFGTIMVGGSTLAFSAGLLSPFWWLCWTGLGVYLGYVPFNSILFDRLLAATRSVGTASFLIYVADSLGYLGSSALYLTRTFAKVKAEWVPLTLHTGEILAVVSPALLLISWLSLSRRKKAQEVR